MRVKITRANTALLFAALSSQGHSSKFLAQYFNVSVRTITDWRGGKNSIPSSVFKKMVNLAGIIETILSPQYLKDFWHIKKAASKGGRARINLYGNFGTPEGRRRGGLISAREQKGSRNGFKQLKKIRQPQYSEKLAEFFGIVFGDGHIDRYQVSVTTNSETDYEHALYVQRIAKELFGLSSRIRKKKEQLAVEVVFSSRALASFLMEHGGVAGNKMKGRLIIPGWINSEIKYQRAFIRGLFDTDGCIYVDRHRIKSKEYYHLGWTITSNADSLRKDIVQLLVHLGFSPTNTVKQNSVYLRKQKEIERYFAEIKSSNQKHLARYKSFIPGGVPKWS